MWRVGKGCVLAAAVLMLTGCVSKWAYDEQVEKAEHLQSVKTEQDIERDGLHADVNALHQAYSKQSMRLTTMEGMVSQTAAELRNIQSRLTTLNQDMSQQRSDLSKISSQAGETLQFLRSLNEQQQVISVNLTQLSGKLDTIRAAPVKAARSIPPVDAGKPAKESVTKDAPASGKGAVERAMEQKMGLAPKPDRPDAVAAKAPTPSPVPAEPKAVSAAKPEAASAPAATSALAGAAAAPMAEAAAAVSASVKPAELKPADAPMPATPIEELSPLQRPVTENKVEAKRKQGWYEWAKEKVASVWGSKKPVQTAAQMPASSPVPAPAPAEPEKK